MISSPDSLDFILITNNRDEIGSRERMRLGMYGTRLLYWYIHLLELGFLVNVYEYKRC